ncbi:ATP-binding protein [Streptomyces katsurahamanus]|uniref:ATP-binding protein n=1 Tax=Streptomyces katsurahamanus TaxID=2577098 RepID=UPI001E4721E6|nr:ATP-binding protein [Streptomyces katsurahamanus]
MDTDSRLSSAYQILRPTPPDLRPTLPDHRPAPPDRPADTRPRVTELRLTAFRNHRRTTLPLTPLTLLAGASGSGKSNALQAYEALALLAAGARLRTVFPEPERCVPEWAVADEQGRRGFRIGCTVDGPVGPVRLDLAVQAEPELRLVGERLSCGGRTLLTTALRDPRRPSVQAAWHTAGSARVTRAPLPGDRLGTALLPLRVAGRTEGQLQVLAAAEQTVVALRSAFVCDPRPYGRHRPASPGDGPLRYPALALVLLTGPALLARDHATEVPAAHRSLTVLADGFDRWLDRGQARALLSLAARTAARGQLRLVGAVADASFARGADGVTVVDLLP